MIVRKISSVVDNVVDGVLGPKVVNIFNNENISYQQRKISRGNRGYQQVHTL